MHPPAQMFISIKHLWSSPRIRLRHSSMQFSSQTPPAQVFAALDGTLTEFAPAAPDIL